LTASLLLSQNPAPWPADADVPAFLASASLHGILGMLAARLAASDTSNLPPPLVKSLRDAAVRQAATEMVQRVELQRVVAALAAGGIDALLMKGASLAYDVYPDPSWRVRSDVDLFIRPDDRARVRSVLNDLDYRFAAAQAGEFVVSQFHGERSTPQFRHLCDVHWKIVNRLRFADALSFDELAAAAIPLPALGPSARGIGRMHALWLACVHRAVHHYDQDTLLWLYDVHLLARSLDADDLRRFVALAERSGACRICVRAFRLAGRHFATVIPSPVIGALEATAATEAPSVFLNPGVRPIDLLCDDLRALPGWHARLTLIKEHVFPDAAYMRDGYKPGSAAPLAWLYLDRVAGGARKWLSSLIAPAR
jgi:hypothetical protein